MNINPRLEEIKNIYFDLENSKYLYDEPMLLHSIDERYFFETLKQIGILQGFKNSSNRKYVYSKLTAITKSNTNHSTNQFIDYEYLDNKLTLFTSPLNEKPLPINYGNINENDQLFNQLNINYNVVHKYHFKKAFSVFSNNLPSSKYIKIEGFQRIIKYFFFLFIGENNSGLYNTQRIINFFFKDFVSDYQNKYFPYNFITDITGFLIRKLNIEIYEEIKQRLNCSDPFWTCSWVLNWLINESKDILIVYRIFDYLIVSHPLAIYYLCAMLTVEEFKRMKILKNELSSKEICENYEKIDLRKYDINKLILKTERFMNELEIKDVISEFGNKIPKESILRITDINIYKFYKLKIGNREIIRSRISFILILGSIFFSVMLLYKFRNKFRQILKFYCLLK